MRYVTYKVEVHDPEIEIHDQSAAGLNRLPEPWRVVAQSFAVGSRERDMANTIASALVTDPLPALLRVGATVKPTPTASEVNAIWEPPQ